MLRDTIGLCLDWGIEIMVRVTGKGVLKTEALREPVSLGVVATGWLRRLKSSGNVVYAGLYSTAQIPGEENPCVKVTSPCRGSANVYLRPVAHADGSFGLDSSGSAFGRSGLYRLVDGGPDHWRVRNFATLHELFRVYLDGEEMLPSLAATNTRGFRPNTPCECHERSGEFRDRRRRSLRPPSG